MVPFLTLSILFFPSVTYVITFYHTMIPLEIHQKISMAIFCPQPIDICLSQVYDDYITLTDKRK